MVSSEDGNKVNIIVVNWNGQRFLDDCLSALSIQTYANYEIILVDNGSSDNSVCFTREKFPLVKIATLEENRGFTGGNATGLKIAEGSFIALVNNDTRVHADWLEKLVAAMLADPGVGVCASKLMIEGTDSIDSAGDGITTAGVGFNRGHGEDCRHYGSSENVFAACAAGCLYRRQLLDEVDFLDDDFFLYDEDVDLSFRAQLAGWKCVYVADAVVYHKGNATAGRLSDTHVYYHTRNLEFVWIKNMPLGLIFRFAPHKILQELGSFCYLCLRHGKWSAYFRAKRDAVKMTPAMLQKRKKVQSRRRVSNRYLRQMMTSIFSLPMIRQKFFQFVNG